MNLIIQKVRSKKIMKDEIKEKIKAYYIGNDIDKLLDYIINLQKNYERIYNENCKLREKHNITDISLLDENNRLQEKIKNILNKLKESAIWYDDSKDLLDYITNLQEENERLKGDNEFLKKELIKLERKYLKDDLLNILQGKSDEQ